MVLGMILFGQNSVGWRIPSVIFGVLNIYLIYLITKKLFSRSKHIPLIAAALYSLETLTFVQSRIAMNDTFMISFILISLLALLNKKPTASALSFGLSIATKWSSIYLAPVLLLVFLLNQKPTFKKLLHVGAIYLFIAPITYLLSYLPFFVFNHTWAQFVELQKQMYWYHTNLQATHSYSSPWWSWPLMLRPVWYYVYYGQGTIANIYALGNVFIFYPGLAAIAYCLYYLTKQTKKLIAQNRSLIISLAAYAAFLLPWAMSPRIMFAYHYLPSTPFMVIVLAWTLHKLLKPETILFYIFLVSCFFIIFFPYLTAIQIPSEYLQFFHWLPGWR